MFQRVFLVIIGYRLKDLKTESVCLVTDLFLFCFERDFMMSLSDDKQADVIDAFNTTSRYLDDILNIYIVYFDNMVSQIYPSELQLNKANASDTEAAFLVLHLSISNDIVSTKNYDKRDDFDFGIVNFPFIDGDVADLFMFCYERDFMMSLSGEKQADITDAFSTTSRYLEDISNINNVYFDTMVSQIYPTFDTKAAFLYLHLAIFMILFLPKFMINVTTLISKLSMSHF